MGRFNIKKHDTFIDMTPMSDVMVLLLTFFMLTSTFIKPEPVEVNTPGSVSEILVEKTGRIFMSFDKKGDAMTTLDEICEKYSLTLSAKEKSEFGQLPAFGLPIQNIPALMKLPEDSREAAMSNESNKGIPCDSTNNQFKDWVLCAKDVNPDLRISIKADAATPYKVIKQVMTSLQDIKENRYNLITSLKKVESVDE